MKIIAMLSYFDEDPALLYECVSRLRALGVDTLVAVDGPYDLLEVEAQISPLSGRPAIVDAAISGERPIDLALRSKSGWEGNEVEKRNYMLEVALERAEEGDWLLVVDADHMWHQTFSYDLYKSLALAEVNPPYESLAAEVSFAEAALEEPAPSWYEARLLLRAVPGMRYEGAHWRVVFPDGRAVSTLRAGSSQLGREESKIIDLRRCFSVRHLKYELPVEREKRQDTYYHRRDAGEGIER